MMKNLLVFLSVLMTGITMTCIVSADPDCTATGDLSDVCAGTTGLQAMVPTGPSGTTYGWTISANGSIQGPTNQPSVTYSANSAGVLTLSIQVTDPLMVQCNQDYNLSVFSNPTAMILVNGSSASSAEDCGSILLNLNGNPSGGTPAYIHQWTGSGTSYLSSASIQSPVFTCSSPGTYGLTYTVTDSNGCHGSDILTITVHANPTTTILADGSSADPADACLNTGLPLNGNPSGGSGSWASHLWTGTGAGYLSSTTIQSPVFTGLLAGSFSLTYRVIDSEGCEGLDSIIINVYQNPTATILVEGVSMASASVCAGSSLGLNGNPGGGSGSYIGHLWTGTGAGYLSSTGIQSPIFTCSSPGLYSLLYTVTDSHGCTGQDSLTIQVNVAPSASITSNGTAMNSDWLCLGEPALLNGNPTGGTPPYTSHIWAGNTAPLSSSTIPNPTFQTSAPGDYFLTYTVTDSSGCTGTDTLTIHVENPICDIEINGATISSYEVCAGITVDLNGNPSGGSSGRIHMWTGNITPLSNPNSQEPDFNTNTPGIYNLTYTVTDNQGCSASDSITITVHPNPVVDILMGGLPLDTEWLCIDEPLTLDGNPSGGSNIFSIHTWTGNGATHLSSTSVQSPVFQSPVAGFFTLNYRVTDSRGCIDTDTVTIRVANPIPDIEANGAATASMIACSGQGVILNGNPKNGSRLYVSHTWTGQTAPLDRTDIQSPIFNTTSVGTYALTYTVIDDEGCVGIDTISVTVNPIPAADAGPDTLVLFGNSVTLDASASSCTGGCDFYWEVVSGDTHAIDSGETSAQCAVSPQSATVFRVTVTDSGGCWDSDTVVVTVGDIPIPTLTMSGIVLLLALLGGWMWVTRGDLRNRLRFPFRIIPWVVMIGMTGGLVSAQTIRFVDPGSSSPSAPYDSWQTAGHTIQTVINASVTGDIVVVANGTYTENILLNREIFLTSWCLDPEFCIISAVNPIQPAVTISDPDIYSNQIVLAGFTIQGGSKAIYLQGNFSGNEFPLIRNCVVANYPGIGIHCYNAGFNVEFCTLVNNNVALFADETRASSRVSYTIFASNTLYGLQVNTSYLYMRNNCYFDNGTHIYGAPVAYCDEWSAEQLPNGVDPQFMTGNYRLSPGSPCINFIQPSGHVECNDILFDHDESPFDLGAYGGYGSPPASPFMELASREPEPGDYRIPADSDISFTIWDDGTAGLDLTSLSVEFSNHGYPAETFTQSDMIITPHPVFGPPPQDCLATAYDILVPGSVHQLFADFAYVRVTVTVWDRSPNPNGFSHHWEFHADDLNPPVVHSFYPGNGATSVLPYGPIEIDLSDAGVGYDPESMDFTLNGDPVSLNLSEITWDGNHVTIIPRPRFVPGSSNTLTFHIADFYGNTLPVQTVMFTCAGDTDAPFVSGITGPASSPALPSLAPRPDPDNGSSDADATDPVTFSFQDFSSVVNLANLEVRINTGSNTYRYYHEPMGGYRVFQVSGDPMARRISCYPSGGWPVGRTITVTISGGTDTASVPNAMQTAVYTFQCATAPVPSLSPFGIALLLTLFGMLLIIHRQR
ncbi:hypothetical protein JXA80_13610 [bacterium]|nr:hypothetical protein [candidate division CSSED10-310 bacterium]